MPIITPLADNNQVILNTCHPFKVYAERPLRSKQISRWLPLTEKLWIN